VSQTKSWGENSTPSSRTYGCNNSAPIHDLTAENDDNTEPFGWRECEVRGTQLFNAIVGSRLSGFERLTSQAPRLCRGRLAAATPIACPPFVCRGRQLLVPVAHDCWMRRSGASRQSTAVSETPAAPTSIEPLTLHIHASSAHASTATRKCVAKQIGSPLFVGWCQAVTSQ
jgi:hypothetical protein